MEYPIELFMAFTASVNDSRDKKKEKKDENDFS